MNAERRAIEAAYANPGDVSAYPATLTTRQSLAVACAALEGLTISPALRQAALCGLRCLLAQKGCEHIEGLSGLPETCDVAIFG